ncbi:MAG TPA: sensor domain-containing diguanylate cyclase [Azospirillum sp.]|nr:sensor domain-containing diguanylate cyclase [Azospirillum sp.]
MHRDLLSPFGGEFADPTREAAFQAERLPETVRHARLLFALSVVLNTLFFASDWRFYGDPHFYVAIAARAVVVGISLACFVLASRAGSFRRAQAVMLLWQGVTAAAVAVLVSSRSDIALMVVLMLPAIYYLAVPTSFRITMVSGIGSSALMLGGYLLPGPLPPTLLGLTLVVVLANGTLLLVVHRTNRLRRQEWAATQAERQAKDDLADSRAMIERMFMAAPIPMFVTTRRESRLVKANDAAYTFFGGDPAAFGVHTIDQLYVDPSHRAALLAALDRDGRVGGFETQVRLGDGSRRDVLLAATPLDIAREPCLMCGVVDITSRKALESHLEWLATTDPLTGLANRNRFFTVAEVEMRRAERVARPVSVLMIDLDHFKRVNDTHGHEVGDAVLKAFARLSRAALRPQDLVARFGGEEFAVLLPETDRNGALAIAERLRAEAEGLRGDGVPPEVGVTVSIGVSEIDKAERTPDLALSRADRALYAAKRAGRNRVVDFTAPTATVLRTD